MDDAPLLRDKLDGSFSSARQIAASKIQHCTAWGPSTGLHSFPWICERVFAAAKATRSTPPELESALNRDGSDVQDSA